ncbi:hypothetical protein HMI54_006314 [Coelomomyces lativittatus]|nr:hypothetical protein HMI55_004542 [Coelomomyces lativittatus]KAJ1505088.1 hypothetical protein HMI54_006314 [Coelomomyces lativittatus]
MSNVDPSFPAATTAVTIATDNTLNLNTKIDAKLSEPLKINPNLTQPGTLFDFK